MEIMKTGKLVAITGPSGAGRTTVLAVLQKNYSNFVEPTRVTTRTPRPGEVSGKHYHFVSSEEFCEGIERNSFLFWSQHAGSFYGIKKDTVFQMVEEGKNVILEIDLGEDINAVKMLFPDMISIYIIPPNVDSMIRRLIAREHNDMDRIQDRINVYEAEAYAALKTDAILVNEYPEDTSAAIAKILDDQDYAKKLYDEGVELIVQLKKALKGYRRDSRFVVINSRLQQYKEDPGGLHTVEIPEGVTSIGDGAFRWCESLSEVRIPHSVTDIGNRAFMGCECLKSITIPHSVRSIGEEVFMGCIGLNKVRIPASIKTIANGMFRGCSEIMRIHIPDSVTSIGEEAFAGCSSLSTISVPDDVYQIGAYAFSNCNGLIRFIIPMGLSSISAGMFFRCYSLLDMNIPDTITKIGEQAFAGCRHLTDVAIPAATVQIGARSFVDCVGLRNVTFANDATRIDEHAFENCTSLSRIVLPRKASAINEGTFEGCTSLEDVVFPIQIMTIGKNAFKGCNQLKHVVIPPSVTMIKQGAFADCRGLRYVEIPESVVTIEDQAFDGCYGLIIRTAPGSFAERYARENWIGIEFSSTSHPVRDILNKSVSAELTEQERLLADLVKACCQLQAEKHYWGTKENSRNTYIRNALDNMGYVLRDQSLRGISGGETEDGELDLDIRKYKDTPWTICEALRINSGSKTDWNFHLKKLLDNYNPNGVRFLVLLTYVDDEKDRYDQIWNSFKNHIQGHDEGGFAYQLDSFKHYQMEPWTGNHFIQTAKCKYVLGGYIPTVYHIFVRMGR